jgi:CRISPR/Cas system-associated endonuclease Cas3-HD
MNGFKHISMDQGNPKHAYNLLEHTVNVVKNLNDMLIEANVPEKDRMIAVLSAIFHDFGKMDPSISRPSKSTPGATSYPGHENVSADIAEEVLRRLGFGNERFLVEKIVKEHMRPHGEIETPKSIGKFLREFEALKVNDDMKERLWRLTYLHSIADSMSKGAVDYHGDVKHKQDTIKTIEEFINNQAATGKKPLLDGKEIIKMFPEINPKTGFIKIMQEALLQAQDEGKVIDKNSAEKFLRDNKNSLMTI